VFLPYWRIVVNNGIADTELKERINHFLTERRKKGTIATVSADVDMDEAPQQLT
jgi:ABC-type amino acid transport substrate-binding protein